jgi:hypothetical protein
MVKRSKSLSIGDGDAISSPPTLPPSLICSPFRRRSNRGIASHTARGLHPTEKGFFSFPP